jgi:hypothetical protein
VLLRVTLALFVIGFATWLVLSWTTYRRQYSATGVAWHRGARNFIEITVVPEDRENLACAADAVLDGLHCGFGADHRPHRLNSGDGRSQVLSPYNTVSGELFLAAGLWDSPALAAGLPKRRFTVMCDLDIVGGLRTVALRWTTTATFEPIDRSLAVGTLRDCILPP